MCIQRPPTPPDASAVQIAKEDRSDEVWQCVKLRDLSAGISVVRGGLKVLEQLRKLPWPT